MKQRLRPAGGHDPAFVEAEQLRLSALLGSVSSHTLLKSLAGLDSDSEDARIITAALMERLTAHSDDGPGAAD